MVSFSSSGDPLRRQFFEFPHTRGDQLVAWMPTRQESSESMEEHPIVNDSARLAEQILTMGRQHAMLDNRHRVVEGDHNELLHHVTSLEKGLAMAEKKRDEAVAALEESQRREEDQCTSTAKREKLFVE